MAKKNEIIQFKKTVTYELPENNWDDAEKWYQNVYENIYNLNSASGSKINIASTYPATKDMLTSGLQSRIDNKNNLIGDYGYGKCMQEIIGEYHISLDDKEGYEKKVNMLSQILDIFNQDLNLTNYDPLEKKEQKLIFDDSITPKEAAKVALEVAAVQNPKRINMGRAMGFVGNNFPQFKKEMPQIASMMKQSLSEIVEKVKERGRDEIKRELESKYPQIFEVQTDEGPTKLKEPLLYIFKYDDIEPLYAYYQIGDEVYEIPLADLIKMMKHDKKAYHFLNQHKPGGPQWPEMAGTDYYLVISNDPFMNMTKSTGRHWQNSSCEVYNGMWNYAQGPMSDVLYGNCVVFAFAGSTLPKGWPQIQPAGREILLGRQNLKWGYKENKEGDIGIGLDPRVYGGTGAGPLLTKALASIVATTPYFDYKSMRTPYFYQGHCDVGSGTGHLTYSTGNGCITNIKAPKVNPEVIVAGNENIGYVAFERLTRPIIDKQVKMILAQNPNIWAIAGNEAGIGRLIRTKDLEIIRFLVMSETTHPEALLGIIDIIPEVDPTWEDINVRSSLPFLVANHPNATSEVHKRLLKLHPGYIFEGKFYDAIEVLYGGIGYNNTSDTPYVCNGDIITINKLLKKIRTKGKKNKALLSKSLLFSPHLDEAAYLKVLDNIQEGIGLLTNKDAYLSTKICREVGLSYILPLTYNHSWAFEDNPFSFPFSISTQQKFDYGLDRQISKATDKVMNLSYMWFAEIIQGLRNKKCFNSIWRTRKKYQIPSYLFTRKSRDILDFNQPSSQILYGSKQLIATLNDGEYSELRYIFENGDEKIIRRDADPIFVSEILKKDSLIEEMGWGLVSLWISDPVGHFDAFNESIYQNAFNGLYLGDGNFAEIPDNPFELYEMVQDISILEESAIDMIFDEGGLARNPHSPSSIQNMMVGDWVYLSDKYGGSYGEYLDNIYEALSVNPNLDKNILVKLYGMESYHKELSKNPNTPPKYLFKLFEEYPSWVLTNPSIDSVEFSNLWNVTMDVLSTMVNENPNRLFDKFRINDVLERNKGPAIRKSLQQYLGENFWVKYWRGGNIKKGKFHSHLNQNLYTEGIADYPIIPTTKSIVIKFSDDPDEYLDNKVYYLNKIEKVDKYNLFIEGSLTSWTEGAKRIEEEISQRIGIDEFFEYIPESDREENLQTTNEEGEVVEINAPRWRVDNIFLFTDEEVFEEATTLPSWRFDFNQKDTDRIIKSYILRNENIPELLTFLETPIMTQNYTLNQELVFKMVDALKMWNKDIVNGNLATLLNNKGELFVSLENLPLTKTLLDISLIQNQKEFVEEFEIHNMTLKDLSTIQNRILDYPLIPISYVYAIINSNIAPAILNKARQIRKQRPFEYIEYYRKMHPAVNKS